MVESCPLQIEQRSSLGRIVFFMDMCVKWDGFSLQKLTFDVQWLRTPTKGMKNTHSNQMNFYDRGTMKAGTLLITENIMNFSVHIKKTRTYTGKWIANDA